MTDPRDGSLAAEAVAGVRWFRRAQVLLLISLALETLRQLAGISGHGGGVLSPYSLGLRFDPAYALPLTLLVTAVTAALYITVFVALQRGNPWARVLGSVFSVVAILVTGASMVRMIGAGALVGVVIGVLFIAVNVLWQFCAWRPEFTDRMWARRGSGLRAEVGAR